MDKKKVANLCLTGGIVFLIVAVIIRLINLVVMMTEAPFGLPIQGIWKLSTGLLLISIAASVCKD